MSNETNPWTSFHRPKPDAKLRLFCLPFAGGGASNFRLWVEGLPAWIDVVPIQYPGHELRLSEPLLTRLDPLVDGLRTALQPLLDLPFAIYGHSMGTLVGFELARSLRLHHGVLPERLFVAARLAPDAALRETRRIHHLPEEAFIKAVQSYGGIPNQILQEPELRRMALDLLRADFTLLETYEYGDAEPLECPIVAYGGEGDLLADEQALETWRPHGSRAFRSRMFPGGHFFLTAQREALLADIAAELAACTGAGVPTRA